MKYLGIDVGSERVGLAISDDSGSVAFPLEEIDRKSCERHILQVIRERDVSFAVFGESLDLSGCYNPIMEDVRLLAESLRPHVCVFFEPEQFSTQAAGRLGKGSDAEAATLILQSYLDRQRSDVDEDILFD